MTRTFFLVARSLGLGLLFLLTACQDHETQLSPQVSTPARLSLHYDSTFAPIVSAHRGGKNYSGYPENCLETMQHLADSIDRIVYEVDVARTSDGRLVLMHDRDIERTTTGQGAISSLSYDTLQQFFLIDDRGNLTTFKIPSLKAVMHWAKMHQKWVMLDIKSSVNTEALIDSIYAWDAAEVAVFITYRFSQAEAIHRRDSTLWLSVGMNSNNDIQEFLRRDIHPKRVVAFTGVGSSSASVYQRLHELGIACIMGTMGSIDQSALINGSKVYQYHLNRGVDILATDRAKEAAEAIKTL